MPSSHFFGRRESKVSGTLECWTSYRVQLKGCSKGWVFSSQVSQGWIPFLAAEKNMSVHNRCTEKTAGSWAKLQRQQQADRHTPCVATPSGSHKGLVRQSRVMCTQWQRLRGKSGCLLGIGEFCWGQGEILNNSGRVLHLGTFVPLQEFQMEQSPLASWSCPKNKTCASSMLPFPLELKMRLGSSGYHTEAGHATLLSCRGRATWRALEVCSWSSIQVLRTKLIL